MGLARTERKREHAVPCFSLEIGFTKGGVKATANIA